MRKTKTLLSSSLLVVPGLIERRIYFIRGQKVMLDSDLADLYEVPTKVLNQAVSRHLNRFPGDFMFQFSKTELKHWRSQLVTSNPDSKMSLRRPPYAFTEQGVAMLSSVLNSERAVLVNIAIMRAFVRLRQILSKHKDIVAEMRKLKQEQHYQRHDIKKIFKIIEALLTPRKPKPIPFTPMAKIGFRTE